jgi:hypothetical protein
LANLTNYVAFNALTITGRISDIKVVQSKTGDFLAVTMISTLVTDGAEATITFTTTNGLMSLFEKGFLPKGRQLTVTGHIADLSEVYTDDDGNVRMLKRPQIKLTGATVLDGGLGPSPKADKPSVDRNKTVVVRPSDAKPVAETAPADEAPIF